MAEINVSAARFNNLKARLKEVLKNRKYYGDVSNLGSNTYDFTISPATGDIILSDQGAKVINLILSVNNVNSLKKIENDNYILRDITAIETFVTKLESQTPTTATNLCRGGCTGICISHCSTGCSGSCLTGCTGGCATTCSGTCIKSCSSCSGTCTGSGCRSDCASDCMNGAKK